ncbi:restriction endonuclease subunit R [Hymenobacter sp. DG25B]|uniref:type I restriction endonuclease subunit R n=1 Tax=Hymenobacter sp. DG25B TaxID=1385664 RepID=UPI000540BA78|nr:DEAD/DEAH box helicase family protein [Hymenobacter sp. DG25B]AIZ62806.1 restriction endonuclease subunit R [Hymenobacter sp. DG25B]
MLTPEQKARQLIDAQLTAAGWVLQDRDQLNRTASLGVAVREFPTASGPADYALLVEGKLVGVVEAKKEGTSLTAVAEQTARYLTSATKHIPRTADELPFGYEANGHEIRFLDRRDPEPRSRPVFWFHRPETLRDWARQTATLRARLQHLPVLEPTGLRDCQVEAIRNLEVSLKHDRPRALIQMATGSGKTFTAVTAAYRLIKFAGAKRILFLVDRGNLGRQTLQEFQAYATPDDGRKFTELYNVQNLTSNHLDSVNKVTITTIQRLYSMLRGEAEFEEGNEERSGFELPADAVSKRPKEVAYNPALPPETYDFIIIDECHRSIYNVWQQVLEYFDAHLIGLTATPSKQTFGFFNQNLVMEYSHERAVVDGVNVGFDVYRIETEITGGGARVEKGSAVKMMERQTRRRRWETLDDDLVYTGSQLDRSVTTPDQIRTVLTEFRDRLPQLFPGREHVPKTLIFAKTDHHADEIVDLMREVFGKSNDFCKKITYGTTEGKPDELIKRFRNEFNPRVAVTVDMISTGTDIRPLECLIFLRDVRSRVYYDQMKGRGTRTISLDDLRLVADQEVEAKTRFVIVDAVGVTESEKTETTRTERPNGVSFEKLLEAVALGSQEPEHLRALATRLARLDRQLTDDDRATVAAQTNGGPTVQQLASRLFDAVDPVRQETAALALARLEGAPEPTEVHWEQAQQHLVDTATQALNDPALRTLLTKLHTQKDMVIDLVSKDRVINGGFTTKHSPEEAARRLAQTQVDKFKTFITEHRDEITALQVLHNQPYQRRALTYREIKQLAESMKLESPPLLPEHLWEAYEKLEQSRVRGAGPKMLLTNLISLVRFATEQTELLEAYPLTVEQRYQHWLGRQQQAGRLFTEEQLGWLQMMKERIATSLSVSPDSFTLPPFIDQGGYGRARALFGDALPQVIQELNDELAA